VRGGGGTCPQPVVRHHRVTLGRYLPSTHASYVSERMLAVHAHEEYMPRPLAEIKRELEAQRREEAQAAKLAAKQARLAARAGGGVAMGARPLVPRPPSSPAMN
jgi:hypothetical protein